MESFIRSKNYSIKEVKKHNDYLLSLQPQIDYKKDIAEEILQLIRVYVSSSEKLEDYVKGSIKYRELQEKQIKYKQAQDRLKALKYERREVVYESYPHYYTVNKHNYTCVTTGFNWIDEDSYDTYEYEKTYTFFTTMISGGTDVIIDHFKEYCLDYTCKTNKYDNTSIDLIDELLEENELLKNELYCVKFEKKFNLDTELKNIFDIKEIDFYLDFYTCKEWVQYKNEEFKIDKIFELCKDYQEMKDKKFIKEDKYVNYPDYIPYVDFLKLIEIKEYEKDFVEL